MKPQSSLLKLALVLPFVAVGGAHISLAADTTWILPPDPEGGAFTTGANWDTGLVPGAGDNAIIANGGTANIGEDDEVTILSLRVNSGTVNQTGGSFATSPVEGIDDAPTFFVGGFGGATGTFDVSGTSLVTGGRIFVGSGGGTGFMTLSDDAAYSGDAGRVTRIADGAGSTGTLTVTDKAQWTTNDWMIIGSGGTGTVNLSGSTATMTVNGNTYVGDLGGNGTMNVSGDATLQSGDFRVGTGGSTGTLDVSGGALLTTANFHVGTYTGNGSATIGGSAAVNANGEFFVGNEAGSVGDVVIKNSAEVTSSSWVVIGRKGGVGTMTLEGESTYTKTGSGQFSVGNGWSGAGNGTLTIKDSALLDIQSGELWIGAEGDFNTVGEMNVEGGTVKAISWVAVGRNHSSGTLNISGGEFNVLATGTFADGTLGNFTMEGSSTVNAVVNQSAGTFNNVGSDTIIGESNESVAVWNATGGVSNHNVLRFGGGAGSVGTMNIRADAIVNTNKIYVSSDGGSTGHLNLNGGTLTTNFVEKGAGDGGVTFNGGVLKASATSEALFIRDFQAGDLVIAAGGLKIDTNNRAIEIGNTLSGGANDGGLAKLGGGTLTLSGIHTYEGATLVQAGTLVVSGTLTDSAWLGVANNAILVVGSNVSLNETIILALDGGSSINLDFSGTETIGSLVLNGNIIETGTYDLDALKDLGTTYNVSFTGLDATSGFVVTTAVPEPSTVALAALGIGALLFLRRRSARQLAS